jgi:hypothetical protein
MAKSYESGTKSIVKANSLSQARDMLARKQEEERRFHQHQSKSHSQGELTPKGLLKQYQGIEALTR